MVFRIISIVQINGFRIVSDEMVQGEIKKRPCNPEIYSDNTILHIKTGDRYDTVLLLQTY